MWLAVLVGAVIGLWALVFVAALFTIGQSDGVIDAVGIVMGALGAVAGGRLGFLLARGLPMSRFVPGLGRGD